MDSRELWIQAAQDCQREIHSLIERRFNILSAQTKSWVDLTPLATQLAEDYLIANPGKWILAIKELRDQFGCGLMEAKTIVETVRGTLGQSYGAGKAP